MKLMRHQQRTVEVARKHPRYGWFFDCGTGKTISMLAVCDDRPMRTLVIYPKSIMRTAWQRDAQNFPNIRLVVAWSTKRRERLDLLKSDADIVVTNFDTFRNCFKEICAAGFQRFIIDESSAVKNFKAKLSQCAIEFSDRMKEVYLLSGTPAPNNETEYWSQFRCIDRNIFGISYYRFANLYFHEIKRTYGQDTYTVGWRLRSNREEQFRTELASRSWSLRKEDAVDLPEQTDIIRDVELSAPERSHYKKMFDDLRIELDGETHIANVNAKTMKLRQITGGNIYVGGEPNPVGKSKLDELASVLDEIGNRKVVIWAEFTADIDRIAELVSDRAKYVVLDGRTKDAASCVERFQDVPDVQYAICQPQSAGHGITLTAANYAVYYSMSFSYEYHKQSRDRIHRTGQKHPCTYIYLCASNTIDTHIMDVVHRKKDAHEAIMELLSHENTRASREGSPRAARKSLKTGA